MSWAADPGKSSAPREELNGEMLLRDESCRVNRPSSACGLLRMFAECCWSGRSMRKLLPVAEHTIDLCLTSLSVAWQLKLITHELVQSLIMYMCIHNNENGFQTTQDLFCAFSRTFHDQLSIFLSFHYRLMERISNKPDCHTHIHTRMQTCFGKYRIYSRISRIDWAWFYVCANTI